VTLFGLVFTPLFYVLIRGLVARGADEPVRAPQGASPLLHPEHVLALGDGGAHA
jgi:hypothetical protein